MSRNVEAWFSGCNSKFSSRDKETWAFGFPGLWHQIRVIARLIVLLQAGAP